MEKKISINGIEQTISNVVRDESNISFEYNGKKYSYNFKSLKQGQTLLNSDGENHILNYSTSSDGEFHIFGQEFEAKLVSSEQRRSKSSGGGAGSLNAPMPGKIFKIIAAVGDELKKGDSILIMEAMKMEHTIKAPIDGKLAKICFNEGDQVTGGAALAVVEGSGEN
ncbi:MAG: acetyl-CoA carboxylase biotin carboxyl carrier protein subunit [Bacteriovoracaceae bacterium]